MALSWGNKMSSVDNIAADPISEILRNRGTMLRGVALIAGIAGLLLPLATSSAMGTSQSVSLANLAGWAFIAPVALAAALVIPGIAPAKAYSRLADLIAAAAVVVAAVYAIYGYIDGMQQMSRATAMMGAAYSNSLGVSLTPGIGLFAIVAAAAIATVQAVRALKGA